jgi:hypothetical protein
MSQPGWQVPVFLAVRKRGSFDEEVYGSFCSDWDRLFVCGFDKSIQRNKFCSKQRSELESILRTLLRRAISISVQSAPKSRWNGWIRHPDDELHNSGSSHASFLLCARSVLLQRILRRTSLPRRAAVLRSTDLFLPSAARRYCSLRTVHSDPTLLSVFRQVMRMNVGESFEVGSELRSTSEG